MAAGGRSRGAYGGASPAGMGLRLLAVALGVFFVAMAADKISWLTNGSSILLERLGHADPVAHPAARWYMETIVIPGAPLFARLVPLGEASAGLALLIGFWPRIGAGLALFMVLNFHFAAGNYWHMAFLRNGDGLPVIGGLLAVVVSGRDLPWSVKP